MSTKYYLLNGERIGVLQGAGLYCYDCKISLYDYCGYRKYHGDNFTNLSCPSCKRRPESGVLKFTWSMRPSELKNKSKVVDEYDKFYSMKEFKELIYERCLIQYFHYETNPNNKESDE